VTDLAVPSDVTLFMECDTVGIEPLHKLVHDGENTERHLHASVVEALSRLHYKSHEIQAIQNIMLGHHSLAKAHAINHTALRKHGFTTEIIANIEAYLPQAASLRHAVTPWVVGIEFCRDILKISAAQLDKPNFNLLSHLGFSEREIAEANAFCYGLDKLSTPALHTKDITVFATSQSVSEAATIRMAAAVQSFVSGETGLAVRVPAQLPTAQVEKILLEAWRRGVKSLTIDFDANMENKSKKMSGQTVRRKTPSKLTTSAIIRSKAPALPKRSPRSNIGKHPISAPGRSKPRHAGH
jgi:ribonucleoside-diphosphate reductase alpha chain